MSHRPVQATAALVGILVALFAPAAARAEYGVESFDVQTAAGPPGAGDEGDLAATAGTFSQAGGHPYSVVTHIEWNNRPNPSEDANLHGKPMPEGDIRDAEVELPPGLVGNPSPLPTCTAAQLFGKELNLVGYFSECPTDSQVGIVRIHLGGELDLEAIEPIFNMVPPTGAAARFGFNVGQTLVYLDGSTGPADNYRITVGSHGSSQALWVYHIDVDFWGVPGAAAHNAERCNRGGNGLFNPVGTVSHAPCPGAPGAINGPHAAGTAPVAFLTVPTSCPPEGRGEEWEMRTNSWEQPELFSTATAFTHLAPFAPDVSAPGAQQGMTGCNRVPFNPALAVQPTQQSATSSSGLEVNVAFPSEGLINPTGVSQSHLKKAVVALPVGVSINPSQGDGLDICTPQRYAEEKVDNAPGEGCPSTSKIGTVVIDTPLLKEPLEGNVYVAKPYDNPFGTLLALYIVVKNHDRGILLTLPGKVETDPRTGQITTTFDDLPQVPFESFSFKFREGPRAPLVTPQACGTYTTEANFYPWARPDEAVPANSSFTIDSGVGGGPCPTGGLPRFAPDLVAGTLNNRAASYSPFDVRLLRSDDEQEFTNFSLKLPPGVVGKLAGVGYCSDAAIAAAKEREGAQGGGEAELASPSCPASSEVGHTLVGAGVGSVLTYAPGRVYLAGPYHGSALSIVSITAAKVGPFDLGTVVVRFALRVNPETAEVFVDSTGSDPIPHIIHGITVHLRDIRAYIDRPEFILNPSSCERTSVASTLLGSGLDFASVADDLPVTVATPFQAADCAALGFKPTLKLFLSGALKRSGNPTLRAIFTPRPGDANLRRAQVTLPHSEFLDNSHIRTVCTRVQFKQGSRPGEGCPAGSIYGHARAVSPILDEPLEGPVFLRSNPERELPDLVAALHAPQFDINAIAHIDSIGNGRIRTTFEGLPDAPITKVVITMAGAKKGLLENSRDLCRTHNRAIVQLEAQNGKERAFKPLIHPMCGKHKHRRRSAR